MSKNFFLTFPKIATANRETSEIYDFMINFAEHEKSDIELSLISSLFLKMQGFEYGVIGSAITVHSVTSSCSASCSRQLCLQLRIHCKPSRLEIRYGVSESDAKQFIFPDHNLISFLLLSTGAENLRWLLHQHLYGWIVSQAGFIRFCAPQRRLLSVCIQLARYSRRQCVALRFHLQVCKINLSNWRVKWPHHSRWQIEM